MFGKKVKQDSDLKNTILVLISSMGQRGDAKQSKEIGFAAYLIKPVKPQGLSDMLDKWLASPHNYTRKYPILS